MALTIQLTPIEDKRLRAAAQRRGIAPAELAHQLLSKHLSSQEPKTEAAKPAPKQLRGYGMFAHLPGGIEEFALEKQQEIEREERRFESRT